MLSESDDELPSALFILPRLKAKTHCWICRHWIQYLISLLSQDHLCAPPNSLWRKLQCTHRREVLHGTLVGKQQSGQEAKGPMTHLRGALFPSFAEIVFQMEKMMRKSKENQQQQDHEPGKKVPGKDLEESIIRLKVKEERRRRRVEVGGERGGGGRGGGGGAGIRHVQFEGRVEKGMLRRGHQCYYNPASCYWTKQQKSWSGYQSWIQSWQWVDYLNLVVPKWKKKHLFEFGTDISITDKTGKIYRQGKKSHCVSFLARCRVDIGSCAMTGIMHWISITIPTCLYGQLDISSAAFWPLFPFYLSVLMQEPHHFWQAVFVV